MSMTLNKTLQLGDLSVTVRELTVGEVRVWMKRMAEDTSADPVNAMLVEEISLDDLVLMSSLEPEQLDELTPTQLRQVYDACREVNRDFFGLRERVEAMGARLLAQLSGNLSATPAP